MMTEGHPFDYIDFEGVIPENADATYKWQGQVEMEQQIYFRY